MTHHDTETSLFALLYQEMVHIIIQTLWDIHKRHEQALLQSSISKDPSEINLISWFIYICYYIIVNVENEKVKKTALGEYKLQ